MYKLIVDSGLIAVLLQTDLQLAEIFGRTVIVERIFGWGSGVFLFGGSCSVRVGSQTYAFNTRLFGALSLTFYNFKLWSTFSFSLSLSFSFSLSSLSLLSSLLSLFSLSFSVPDALY